MTVGKQLIEDIKELRKSIETISVYNISTYSMLELYYKLARKINELIKELGRFEGVLSEEIIKQNEQLMYLLGEGLHTEVVDKINLMITDGSFNTIINKAIFNDLNYKIESVNKEVNLKVDKINGMGLSTNDYTNYEKTEVLKIKDKADISYVDTLTSNIVSGSPKGIYNTLTDLITDKPTGGTGIYLVKSDGCFYYWNENVWAKGWEYLVDTTGSLQQKTTLTSEDDLNNINNLGIYYINSNSLPLNLPIQTTGVLMVIRQTKNEYNFGISQIFYSSNETYFRYRTSSGYSNWKQYATQDNVDTLIQNTSHSIRNDGVFRKDILTNAHDLNNVVESGIYYIASSSLPLNMPRNQTGLLIVTKGTTDSFDFGITQQFMSGTSSYFRYRTSSGYSNWIQYITDIPITNYDFLITKDSINKTFTPWSLKGDLLNNSFGTIHKKGDIIPTIPYMSRFKNGRDILYNTTLSTFYSMVENPASDLYLSGDYGYFGAVCTTLSGYLCGQDIYYTSGELFDVLDFYTYHGGCSLRIGDNMVKEGHSRIITDILVDDNGKVKSIGVAEAGGPLLYYRLYTISQFENQLKVNGGDYTLGRFPNYKAKELEKIEFPTDCIPNRGHKGIYKTNETIKLYVETGATTLYYKKFNESNYSSVPLSSLPAEIINASNVYDITLLINDYEVWCLSTNLNNKPCLILKCDTGNVNLNDNTFNVSDYSKNLSPLWYQVNELKESSTDVEYYPAPDGYIANVQYSNKDYINKSGDTQFVVKGKPKGYYIRALYQTPFGQVHKDSDYVII